MEMVNNVIIPLFVGLVLGCFFYGGLFWTVKRLATSQRVGSLFIFSFVLRTSLVVLGLYITMNGQLDRLIAFSVGFLVIRFISTRYFNPQKLIKTPVSNEAI